MTHAHVHALLNIYHPMEMIGHGDLGEDADVAIVHELNLGRPLPLLEHGLAERGEVDGGMPDVHVELAQQVVAVLHNDGDEVDAAIVIIVALIAWTMGGIIRHGDIVAFCVTNIVKNNGLTSSAPDTSRAAWRRSRFR